MYTINNVEDTSKKNSKDKKYQNSANEQIVNPYLVTAYRLHKGLENVDESKTNNYQTSTTDHTTTTDHARVVFYNITTSEFHAKNNKWYVKPNIEINLNNVENDETITVRDLIYLFEQAMRYNPAWTDMNCIQLVDVKTGRFIYKCDSKKTYVFHNDLVDAKLSKTEKLYPSWSNDKLKLKDCRLSEYDKFVYLSFIKDLLFNNAAKQIEIVRDEDVDDCYNELNNLIPDKYIDFYDRFILYDSNNYNNSIDEKNISDHLENQNDDHFSRYRLTSQNLNMQDSSTQSLDHDRFSTHTSNTHESSNNQVIAAKNEIIDNSVIEHESVYVWENDPNHFAIMEYARKQKQLLSE